MSWIGSRETEAAVGVGSDGPGELEEGGRDAAMSSGFDTEFVVTATNVLHERVTADDHASRVVAFESAHGPEPRLEPAVVGLDPVVRILLVLWNAAGINSSITTPSAGARSVMTSTGSP